MDEQNNVIQSEYIHDLTLQKEFLRGTTHMNRINIVCSILVILILSWFFITIVLMLDAPEVFSKAMLGLTAFYLLISGIQALANRGGGTSYKRTLLTNNGHPVHCLVQFPEDSIITANLQQDSRNSLEYTNVRSVWETENLLLCAMKYRLFLIVDKRTLNVSREEFLDMLFSRCPQIKRRKVRSRKPARLLNLEKWVFIAVLCLIALYFNPTLQIQQRLSGQIHNGMSVREIAAELESFGIHAGNEDTLEMLDGMYIDTFLRDGSKLETILYYAGLGTHDYDTGTWTPSDSGVYYCSYWAYFPDSMYTDLLRGISALAPDELTFENIREDHSHADWHNYAGYMTVDFDFQGSACTYDATFYEEWYDESILNALNEIITEQTGKSLYFADYMEMGCFVFFADEAWAQSFSQRTGLELVTDIYKIY